METTEQDYNKLIKSLSASKKDYEEIQAYRDEFTLNKRDLRPAQVGKIQKDKIVGSGSDAKVVNPVVVTIPIAKKIVNTSVAFEFGKPVKLIPDSESELTKIILEYWKSLRINQKIIAAKVKQKQETQSALLFYFTDEEENKELKCKVLEYSNGGEFFPSFDVTGNMTHFVNIFKGLDGELKPKTSAWIYDEKEVTMLVLDGTIWKKEDVKSHGFDKIPVVYMEQEYPEHYDVMSLIDRLEVAQSKLGGSNDYTGHPILFIEGEVNGLPDKNADGKALSTKVEVEDGKRVASGDVRFITHDDAPESVKLEMETLLDLIYAMSSTPDISFSNLKSVGNVSRATLELMFLDCTLKKLLNEGQNRTDLERIIAIIISGIVTTKKISTKNLRDSTGFEIVFGNVLPNADKEVAETLGILVTHNLISREEAVTILDKVEDIDAELEKIKAQNLPATTPPTEQ